MAIEFFKKLSNDLTNLLENEEDYNVLIEVGQMPDHQIFKAHSVILNSRCPYFHEMLNKTTYNEKNVKKISTPHISVTIFKIIIKYIYGGIVIFNKIDAPTNFDLLTAANEFGLAELRNTAQVRLVENHAPWIRWNFAKVYKISFENDDFKDLQQFCNDIIAKHPNIVFDSEDYEELSESALVSILKLDNLNMDEARIWDQVIRWGIAQNSDLDSNPAQWSNEEFLTLKATLKNCLPHIRFFQITSEDVLDKLSPYQHIFEPNLWKDIMTKVLAPNRAVTSTILPPRIISDTILPPRNIEDSIYNTKRNEAHEHFNQGKFLKALELYEEILEHSQHNCEDQRSASIWDLSNNKCGLENLTELTKTLYKNTTLTSLNLGCNNLGSEGGKTLAVALCKNNTLEILNLWNNNLGVEGGKTLADVLCENTTLTSLDLYDNNLESEGIRALANALFKNTTLTFLNLGCNNLKSEEGKALADALCENVTLTSLNLSVNDLGFEGGKALANALCKNTTLTFLNLSFNSLGFEAGTVFADVLCNNTTLTSLDLYNNGIGSEGGKALAAALCKNTTLTSLNFGCNNFESEEEKALSDALYKNYTQNVLNL
ncbi:hypothetical protein C2G38_2169644 [Gigaspora rosea]|uniref:BTB domain-containing protein n=1 Tax=Gigaspora rosea TaxID=44941 RepID=A0A397VRT3_9GLOM|nr:hypothetical protein C2G38_2169644 [Gigaspora rosea]